jgi:putative colanic acid biosysnthesis UDP-glucose lipid carrier transferase
MYKDKTLTQSRITAGTTLIDKSVVRLLWLQRLGDLALVAGLLAATCAYQSVRFDAQFLLLATLACFVLALLFKGTGRYRPTPDDSLADELQRLVFSWGTMLAVLLFIGYLTKTSAVFARSVLLSWAALTPLALLGLQLIVRVRLQQLYRSNRNQRRAVIVGTAQPAVHLAQELRQLPQLAIRVCGFFRPPDSEIDGNFPEQLFLGELSELVPYVQRQRVDVVYITPPITDEQLTETMAALQDTTASVYIIPNVWLFNLLRSRVFQVNGIPMVAVWEAPLYDLQHDLKRLLDILVAGTAILCLAPVMIPIALAVKSSSPGPILFRQRRYGLNGQEITVYKFRSMTVMEDGGQVQQAQREDKRITPIGGFLRRTSLDEVPQLLNVLQGSMSIVGPRPHAVAHNEEYRKLISGYMLRHKVKPGMTGWAQVNGFRGETDTLEKMEKRIEYDLDYINHWSLGLDLKIILQTFIVVLKGSNAY